MGEGVERGESNMLLDQGYLLQIENSSLKKRLLNKEHIPAIEKILERDAKELQRLRNLSEKGKLSFGGKVSPAELQELFPGVCRQVDSFIGIPSKGTPKVGYYSVFKPGWLTTPLWVCYLGFGYHTASHLVDFFADGSRDQIHVLWALSNASFFMATAEWHLRFMPKSYYNSTSGKITLERTSRTCLLPTAAHEYAHHVLDREGLAVGRYTMFQEGYAMGIERHLAREYCKREDNEAFKYHNLELDVLHLSLAYAWMCRKLGREPRKSISVNKTSLEKFITNAWGRFPPPHAVGNALFLVYEACGKKEIYRRMLRGEFKFV